MGKRLFAMMVPALMWGTMVYTNNSIFNINF